MPNGQDTQSSQLDPITSQLLRFLEGDRSQRRGDTEAGLPADTGVDRESWQLPDTIEGQTEVRPGSLEAHRPVIVSEEGAIQGQPVEAHHRGDFPGGRDPRADMSWEDASLATMKKWLQTHNQVLGGNAFKIDPDTGLLESEGNQNRAAQIANLFQTFHGVRDRAPSGGNFAWDTNLTQQDKARIENAIGWHNQSLSGRITNDPKQLFDQIYQTGKDTLSGMAQMATQNPATTFGALMDAHQANFDQAAIDIEEGRTFEGSIRYLNAANPMFGLGVQRIADLGFGKEYWRMTGEGIAQIGLLAGKLKSPSVQAMIRAAGRVVNRAGRTAGRTWAKKTDGQTVTETWARDNPTEVVEVTPGAVGRSGTDEYFQPMSPATVPKTLQQQANEYTAFANRYDLQQRSRHFELPSTYEVGGEKGSIGTLLVGHTMGSFGAFGFKRKQREARIREVAELFYNERKKLEEGYTQPELRAWALDEARKQIPDEGEFVDPEDVGQTARLGERAQLQLTGDVAARQLEAGFEQPGHAPAGVIRPEQAGLTLSAGLQRQLELRMTNASEAGAALRAREADPKNIETVQPTPRRQPASRAGQGVDQVMPRHLELNKETGVHEYVPGPYRQNIGLPVNLSQLRPKLVPLYQKLLVQSQTMGNLPPTSQHLLTMLDGIFQIDRQQYTPDMHHELMTAVGDNLRGDYYVPLSEAREITSILKGFLRKGDVGIANKLGLPSGVLEGQAYSASQALTIFDKFLNEKMTEFEETNPGIKAEMETLNTNTVEKYHILALQRLMHGGKGSPEGVQIFQRYGTGGGVLEGTHLAELRELRKILGEGPFREFGKTVQRELLQAGGRSEGATRTDFRSLSETPEMQEALGIEGDMDALGTEMDRLRDIQPFVEQSEPTALGKMLVAPDMRKQVQTLMQTSPKGARAMMQQWIHDLVGMNDTGQPLQFNAAEWEKFQQLNRREQAELLGGVTTPEKLAVLIDGVQTAQAFNNAANPIEIPSLVTKLVDILRDQPNARGHVGSSVMQRIWDMGPGKTKATPADFNKIEKYYNAFDPETKLAMFRSPYGVVVMDDLVHYITHTTRSDFLGHPQAENKMQKMKQTEIALGTGASVLAYLASGGDATATVGAGAGTVGLLGAIGRYFAGNPKLGRAWLNFMESETAAEVNRTHRVYHKEALAIKDTVQPGGTPDAKTGQPASKAGRIGREIIWLGMPTLALQGRELAIATEEQDTRAREENDPQSESYFEKFIKPYFTQGGVRTQDIELPIQ